MTKDAPLPNQIVCPRCKQMITLPSISMGAIEQCPHCNKWFAVSEKVISTASGNTGGGAEGYGVKIEAAPQVPRSIFPSRVGVSGEDEAAFKEQMPLWRPVQPPPPEIFLLGTFSYPFSAGSRQCLAILLTMTFVVFGLASFAVYFGNIPKGYSSLGALILSLFCTFSSVILGAVLLIAFSAFGLAILRDTADGSERLVSWPQGLFTDWLEETFYILVNLFFGALPAVMLLSVLPDSPGIKMPVMVLSEVIFFPLFLLSALACGSVVMPYSAPVWRSLWNAWHVWILFYLFTILIGEAFVYFLRVNPFRGFWIELIIFSILMPVFWMVYFRLLGRLAWFCSGRFEEMHPPKENFEDALPETEDNKF